MTAASPTSSSATCRSSGSSTPSTPTTGGSRVSASETLVADREPIPSGGQRASRGAWLQKFAERYAIVAVWGLMIGIYSIVESSQFDTSGTFQTIFGSQAALVFLAMAFLCTVIVGEFVDLSVASILGLCATIVPVLSVLHHWNVALASVVAVAVGMGA